MAKRPARKPAAKAPTMSAKKRARTQEVLDAAAEVFSAKGYHGASTKDIADRLGLRQGSLYYYFPSKEQALDVVCQAGVQLHVDGLEILMAQPGSALSKFKALIANHVEPIRDRRDYVRVFLRDRFDLPGPERRKIGAVARRYEDMIETLLRQGIAEGAFRPDLDCRMTALAIIAMGNGVALWYGKEPGVTMEDVIEHYSRLLLAGIRSAKA